MIKFDFNTYAKDFIKKDVWNEYYSKKEEYYEKLNKCDMTGWMKKIDPLLVEKIKLGGVGVLISVTITAFSITI